MLSVGTGPEIWRVRVDLFADDDAPARPFAAAESLRSLLTEKRGDAGPGGCSADGGTGAAPDPVVGLLFYVHAQDIGDAAMTALATAREAGATCGVGPGLYDLVLIPLDAVVLPGNPNYPSLPT
jgi:hypothetical protein